MNLAISFAAALAWASRALARCASLFRSAVSIASSLRGTPTGEPRRRRRRVERSPQVSDSETHHSLQSISPSRSESSCASAASRRDGTSRYCRFLLPQFVRKSITSLSALTAVTLRGNRAVSDESRRWRMSGRRPRAIAATRAG